MQIYFLNSWPQGKGEGGRLVIWATDVTTKTQQQISYEAIYCFPHWIYL